MAANKIKRFFAKKKDDAKFKLNMGQGRKLTDEPTPTYSKTSSEDVYKPPKRTEISEAARMSAEAALSRIERKTTKEFNTSLAAIKAQVKRELEAERALKQQQEKDQSKEETIQDTSKLACQGVYFRCPLVSDEILPKNEWKDKIKDFLYTQLSEEKGLTACLIIKNCNPKEKADDCIETLAKYIENLINHSEDDKYKKIRINNRIFTEKVRYVEGAMDFLNSAGFVETVIDNEPYLEWSQSNLEYETDLTILLDALRCSEVIQLELDRNIQVLLPSQIRKNELPSDFFRIRAEDIKKEQQLRNEAIENAQILKTKAMREKEEQRILNRYKYSLIRIKFPNGIYLQGTFNVYEKLNDIYEFIQSCLYDESIEFTLTVPGGLKLNESEKEKSLYNLRLVPNIVLIFAPIGSSSKCESNYLKEELLMLIKQM